MKWCKPRARNSSRLFIVAVVCVSICLCASQSAIPSCAHSRARDCDSPMARWLETQTLLTRGKHYGWFTPEPFGSQARTLRVGYNPHEERRQLRASGLATTHMRRDDSCALAGVGYNPMGEKTAEAFLQDPFVFSGLIFKLTPFPPISPRDSFSLPPTPTLEDQIRCVRNKSKLRTQHGYLPAYYFTPLFHRILPIFAGLNASETGCFKTPFGELLKPALTPRELWCLVGLLYSLSLPGETRLNPKAVLRV
ncbi:hypothetical protein RRG08_065514 [Elysia crispata]|uniref:Uncharacterized protein n=1 Tax=Elysia crispata TaxID=231223 RepID=A0AAE1B6F0_9GAST|nr:hypothetical protein RRG08_065514 [Elysia crispata]